MGATVFNKNIASGIQSDTNGANVIKYCYTYSGNLFAFSAALASLDIVDNDILSEIARLVVD